MEKIVKNRKICYYNIELGVVGMDLTMDILEEYCDSTVKISKQNQTKKNILSSFIRCYIKYRTLKEKINKMNFSKYIVEDKNIMGGLPVIKGTRITIMAINDSRVYHILKNKDCDLINSIQQDYPELTKSQILSALCYHMKNAKFFNLLLEYRHEISN